ncbi:hypothetical protein ABPG75_002425 [Micractinium tetrahymenae]
MERLKGMIGGKKEGGAMPPASGGPAGAVQQTTVAPINAPPALGRVSTEYGEVEGMPFETGKVRGPLSPRAQAIRDHMKKIMEDEVKIQ